MEKVLDLKPKVMSLENWIVMQKDATLLEVRHSRDGNLTVTGLYNKETGELFMLAERVENQ
jgi:hypothetical protein